MTVAIRRSTGEQVYPPPEDDGKGLECARCGCRHFLTQNTRQVEGYIRRIKVCRNCGLKRHTSEKWEY